MKKRKMRAWLFAAATLLVAAVAIGLLISSTTSARKIQVCDLETHKIVVIDYNDLSPAYSTVLDNCR